MKTPFDEVTPFDTFWLYIIERPIGSLTALFFLIILYILFLSARRRKDRQDQMKEYYSERHYRKRRDKIYDDMRD